MIKLLAKWISVGVIMVGITLGVNVLTPKTETNLGIAIPTVVALFETSLQAKISDTATSMTLVNATTTDATLLSGTYGFVIDEGG